MKLSITPTSTLLFLPLLTIIPTTSYAQPIDPSSSSSSFAPRFEVSDIYKKTLSNYPCTDIRLEDQTMLRAKCGEHDSSLDLNTCFANYQGSLTRVRDNKGGFGGSCDNCELRGTKLACECAAGEGRQRHNEVELDDWSVVEVDIGTGALQCIDTFGIE